MDQKADYPWKDSGGNSGRSKASFSYVKADTSALNFDEKRTSNRVAGQVDSGYAWIICVAAFMVCSQTDGIGFSLGILNPVFLDTYKESVQFTMWISSTLIATMTLSGPLVSYFVSKFGARPVCVAGALLASSGAILSRFANGVWFLIGSLGGMTGFGLGCMLIPALTSVMTWFQKRRPVAIGITMIGAGSGMLIYSSLIPFLLDKFDLGGCLLILGGIILHSVPIGLLLRPSPIFSMRHESIEVIHFDVAVFRIWQFDLFLLACFFFSLGYFPVFLMIVNKAVTDLGLNLHDAHFLLTIIAITNMGGRIASVFLLGRKFINNSLAVATTGLIGGIATSLSLLMHDYGSSVAFCAAYGFAGGFCFLGMPIVMGSLVNPVQVSIASGFFVFSLGIASLCGINGADGNFGMIFLISGAAMCAASMCFFVIYLSPCLCKRRQ